MYSKKDITSATVVLIFFLYLFWSTFCVVRYRCSHIEEEKEFLVARCWRRGAGVIVVTCNKVNVWNWCTSVKTPTICTMLKNVGPRVCNLSTTFFSLLPKRRTVSNFFWLLIALAALSYCSW